MSSPAIAFIWSALAFSGGAALLDFDNILINICGWALISFAILSARALNIATSHIRGAVVHFTGLAMLFLGVTLVNQVASQSPISYAILGLSFPMLFVSGFRLFASLRP